MLVHFPDTHPREKPSKVSRPANIRPAMAAAVVLAAAEAAAEAVVPGSGGARGARGGSGRGGGTRGGSVGGNGGGNGGVIGARRDSGGHPIARGNDEEEEQTYTHLGYIGKPLVQHHNRVQMYVYMPEHPTVKYGQLSRGGGQQYMVGRCMLNR